jgi:hypothetical protein
MPVFKRAFYDFRGLRRLLLALALLSAGTSPTNLSAQSVPVQPIQPVPVQPVQPVPVQPLQPVPAPARSWRPADLAGQSLGIARYERVAGQRGQVDALNNVGNVVARVRTLPNDGTAPDASRYEVTYGGQTATVKYWAGMTFFQVQGGGGSVTVTYEPDLNSWRIVEGNSSLIDVFATPLQYLGAILSDVASSLQGTVARSLTETQAIDERGCYDENGFCGAEYASCTKCGGGLAGAGSPGVGSPGSVGLGAGGTPPAGTGGRVCLGPTFSGDATGVWKSNAIERARGMAAGQCSNEYCVGCCGYGNGRGGFDRDPNPDCACITGDVFCACHLVGRACSG